MTVMIFARLQSSGLALHMPQETVLFTLLYIGQRVFSVTEGIVTVFEFNPYRRAHELQAFLISINQIFTISIR